MEMKTQYRLAGIITRQGDLDWSPWRDLPIDWQRMIDVKGKSAIQFQEVPVKCLAVSPVKLDGKNRQCELDAHDPGTSHHFMFEAMCECETFDLTWE